MSNAAVKGDRDVLGDTFYPLFKRIFNEDGDFVSGIDRKLGAARMASTAELYMSRAIGIGVIAGGTLWIIGTLLGYLLFATGLVPVGPILGASIPWEGVLTFVQAARIPALVVFTGIVFGSIGFAIGFGSILAVPYMRSGERKREINMLLPDAISFMYALSVGGLNQIEILETMAQADDTYGEVAKEFQTIVQETNYFDTDYRTAIHNQAFSTPSSELSQFLTDMLSILNSGGDLTRFLEDKKEKHMRTAKQEQEVTLDTLELFGEMYMTLSLFPLLLIIILVIMSMIGDASDFMLYVTVYALIPLIGVGFLVMISTVKQDEPGNGYLRIESAHTRTDGGNNGFFSLGVIDYFSGEYSIFSHIRRKELMHTASEIFRRPHIFFRNNPLYTLAITIPLSLIIVIGAIISGSAPMSMAAFIDNPVWSTFIWVYVPVYVICIPLAVFHEWNVRRRYSIIGNLSDNLRKLSSANDTGQTLLESVDTVARTSQGKLAEEFAAIRSKVDYGTNLGDALIEFNNKYHIPRLARTVKLITKAQEASSQITEVLTTAAQASENQDDIDRERKSRTLMQVAIIIMTYLTLLAVMAILQVQFIGVLGETGGGDTDIDAGMDFGSGVDVGLLSLMFFHAVTMQAILSGLISGYMRDANLISGVKYIVILVTIALGVWIVVD